MDGEMKLAGGSSNPARRAREYVPKRRPVQPAVLDGGMAEASWPYRSGDPGTTNHVPLILPFWTSSAPWSTKEPTRPPSFPRNRCTLTRFADRSDRRTSRARTGDSPSMSPLNLSHENAAPSLTARRSYRAPSLSGWAPTNLLAPRRISRSNIARAGGFHPQASVERRNVPPAQLFLCLPGGSA